MNFKDQYIKKGYVIYPNLISSKLIDNFLKSFEDFKRRNLLFYSQSEHNWRRVKHDLDENNFLNQTYNISSIPMFVLYQNSEEVWRKNGIIAYDEIVRKIKSYNSY